MLFVRFTMRFFRFSEPHKKQRSLKLKNFLKTMSCCGCFDLENRYYPEVDFLDVDYMAVTGLIKKAAWS